MTETAVSLKDRLTKARAELQADHPIELPVPGYDPLVARYHPLDFNTHYKIEARHDKVKDEAQKILYVACDKLINGCDGLYASNEDGSLEPLEHDGFPYKWDAATARDLFGIEDLPENLTARQALLAIFAKAEMALLDHVRAYVEASNVVNPDIEKELQGESEPAQAGLSILQ